MVSPAAVNVSRTWVRSVSDGGGVSRSANGRPSRSSFLLEGSCCGSTLSRDGRRRQGRKSRRSRTDGRAARVRAGQALQRVPLSATVRGLSTQPMTQVLEVPRLRRVIADPADPWFPQMILRIGYGMPVPRSPRRDWSEVAATA